MSKNPEEQEDQSEACKLNSVELFPKTTYGVKFGEWIVGEEIIMWDF